MAKDLPLLGSSNALDSSSTGAIAGLDISNSSSLAFGSNLIDPFQQERTLFSSSTILTAQAIPPPATNLILDFNGGRVKAGQYPLPSEGKFKDSNFDHTFSAFSVLGGNPNNLDEEILQILAGVREDFAPFNVQVIWDDRGVDSPLFAQGHSTVVMIVGDAPYDSHIGISNPPPSTVVIKGTSSRVDVSQSQRDTAFVFEPTTFSSSTLAWIQELINFISHEAGHTFGLSHVVETDDNRQLMGTRFNDALDTNSSLNLDGRFSTVKLKREEPEKDISYSDEERLDQNLGALATKPDDQVSNQTLPLDPTRVPKFDSIPIKGFRSVSDFRPFDNARIDFSGDRDAFQFQIPSSGRYVIQELSSSFTPVVSLWNNFGNFLQVSTGGTITFDAIRDETYFAVAGSSDDQALTFTDATNNAVVKGNFPDGKTGAYTLRVGRFPIAIDDRVTATENEPTAFNVLTNDVTPTSTLAAKLLRSTAHGTLTLNSDGSVSYMPNPDFFGTDSFTYNANDGSTDSDPATVTITINEATLTDLIGTPRRDILVGTDGRDRIIGLQSGDILTGGKGRDQFVFQNINEGGDRITDFTVGKDKIVLSGLLQSISYSGSNPIADGVISFRQASANLSSLQIDPDGPNRSTFIAVPFILFDNVAISDLSNLDNFVF